MNEATLAIDAGTTSVRALVFDADWKISGRAQKALSLEAPQPGHVEQSPEALWESTLSVIEGALHEAKLQASDINALGITSQRATCLIWEKSTGKPLTPIIGWQDLRGTDRAMELGTLGFMVFPVSSACKLEGAIDSIENGRARMEKGELCWGNVDSFLAFKLSGGTLHATDLSQACATGYLDFFTEQWNDALLKTQGLSPAFFPTLVDTSGILGETDPSVVGASIPIAAIVGDQQSAAIAQDCKRPGDLKITYGTSGTCNVHTGSEILMIPGAYPLVLQRQGGRTDYCIEAMIVTAGAMLDWVGTTFRLPDFPANLDALCNDVSDSAGVFVLPALQGLGSPHAQPDRTAHIAGLTHSTRPEHIVFAVLESIAFRTRDIIEQLANSTELPEPEIIRIDGGLTQSKAFVRILADVIQKPVSVCVHPEATALGAARLARGALGTDSHKSVELAPARPDDPNSEKREFYDALYKNWKTQFGLPDVSS